MYLKSGIFNTIWILLSYIFSSLIIDNSNYVDLKGKFSRIEAWKLFSIYHAFKKKKFSKHLSSNIFTFHDFSEKKLSSLGIGKKWKNKDIEWIEYRFNFYSNKILLNDLKQFWFWILFLPYVCAYTKSMSINATIH